MTYTDAQTEAAAKALYDNERLMFPSETSDWPERFEDSDDEAESVRRIVRAALAAAEEAGGWEYAWVHEDGRVGGLGGTPTVRWFSERSWAPEPGWFRARRRPAGPWLPVEGSEG